MTACDCAQCVLRRARVKAEADQAETAQPSETYATVPRMCVQCHHVWFPIDGWEPPAELTAVAGRVPVELRPVLLVVAYLVSEVEKAGPVSRLSLSDLDDQGRIVAALVDAGLIELYEAPSGVVRWARTPHAEADA